jgi:GTP 3',8-cyclase
VFDTYNRNINYLRVSVTDRCNLRCLYCMPEEGVKLLSHEDILSFDEITEAIKTATELGFEKLRLTGGEPLVRKNITELVRMISDVKGIKDFGLTTNGILLDKFAQELKDAGLHRLNISLDTTDSEEYFRITRGGDLEKVFNGIDAAVKAGFKEIKINTVIESTPDEKNAKSVAEFARKNGFKIRFIKKMDLEKGTFWNVIGGDGGKCSICNRLRISANGTVTPCLFSDQSFNIRELGIKEALIKAINSKPEKGAMSRTHKFYNIGG